MDLQHTEYQQQIRDHLRQAYLLSEDKIDQVMPDFMATLQSLMNDLEQISMSQNTQELNKKGHALKGALLSLGLYKVAELAFSIEKFNPSESDATELKGTMTRLREEMKKIT